MSAAASDLYGLDVRDLDGAAIDVEPCLVCACTRARARFAVEDVAEPVVACEGCGLARFHPMLGSKVVSDFYPDEYYGEPGVKFQPAVEKVVRMVGARHISFLCRGLSPGARVLDVGCGRGVQLGALADRGFEVHGVEISAEAARGADPRAEIRITQRLDDAGYPDGYFDEIVIWHVLEHLEDPRAVFEGCHRILKPGGRLIVAVPNFSSAQARWAGAAWFHLDLPRHLYQFPLAALRRLMEETGFAPQSDHHFSLRQNPFGWIQSLLNATPGLPRNGLYALLQKRGDAEPPPYTLALRAWLLLLFAALAPFALVATALETIARTGATVHVVATRSATKPASSRP